MLVISILPNVFIFAGTGGKIAGRVIDENNKNPLPGVNVIIEGTSAGSATDIHGEYVILNVPPGFYTVKATYIGFTPLRVENLRVNIDQTTRQNFQLATEVIKGEEVTVTAERKLVRMDLTSSQKITTSEEILQMPVESFIGVLMTQAGVNTGADGALHIRGGRSNEIGYYIDGISVSNPFTTNALAINVSNKALEEMKVVSGAFNAEYGNAMSGIVNIQTKDGGMHYHGSLSINTGDYITDDTDLYLNIDDINPLANIIYEGALNGPVPIIGRGGNLTFNISARYSDYEGYLYGIREHLPNDSAKADYTDTTDWYIEMGGDNKFIPLNSSLKLNLMGKLTYRITPRIKISVQALHQGRDYKSYTTSGGHDFRYNPEGTSDYRSNNNNYSLKINHSLNTKSFYQANVFISNTDYKRFQFKPIDLDNAAPVLNENGNDLSDEYMDSTSYVYYLDQPGFGRFYILQDSKYVPSDRISPPNSATFLFGGSDREHIYRQSFSTGFKFDFTSQITTKHEVKFGVSARIDSLQERGFEVLYEKGDAFPIILPVNNSPTHDFYQKTAKFYSAYIQDKIEYDNMIINAGIRYDNFSPNEDYIINLLEPDGGDIDEEPVVIAAKSKDMVSPRLGISFPITDNGGLRFSYGHFYQMPTLKRLYTADNFGAANDPSIGYANLQPEKSTLYEFGLQQQFGRYIGIEASAFYKDTREYLALQTIKYVHPEYGSKVYSIYLNKDYGSVQGFTVSLTKLYDPASRLSIWLDYSYQKAEGNSVQSDAFMFNGLTGDEEEKLIVPLSFDQSHILNWTLMISNPNSWGLTFIGKLAGGWPYTPNIYKANYNARPNSERKPLQKNMDMRIHKTFNIGPLQYVIFAKVYNLFDHRNEKYIYTDTGRAGYTYINRSLQEGAIEPHYGEAGVKTWEEYYYQRPHYYTAPRSVKIGVSIDF